MYEPTVTGGSTIELTNLVRAVLLPGLLGAFAWATWRLGRTCTDRWRYRQGDPS